MRKIIKELSIVVARLEDRAAYYQEKSDCASSEALAEKYADRAEKYADRVQTLEQAQQAVEDVQHELEGLI